MRASFRTRLILAVLTTALTPSAALADGQYDLVGQLPVVPQINYTDVWGWSHPTSGRHYALVGNNATGLHIIDVTDPTNPFEASRINTVPRYEMKTWQNYVYTVDGLTGPGGITDLTNPALPEKVGSFPGGHTLWIDDEGFLYVSLPGLKVYDLNINPLAPPLVWEIPSTDGHDCVVVDDVLYLFFGYSGTFLFDVSNRHVPVYLGGITDPAIEYNHHGWPSQDRTHLFILDEFALSPAPDITVWNITDPAAPVKVGSISDPTSSAHNGFVIGNYLYVAYYNSGFRVYDVSTPSQPVMVDEYDTNALQVEGNFDGAWGVYPFGPNGTVYVNDRPNGLFVFQAVPTGVGPPLARSIAMDAARPNPFSASTRLGFTLEYAAEASLEVYDIAGRRVRTLARGQRAAGHHDAAWDGKDDAGREVASGVYFVRLRAGSAERVQKTVIVR